MKVIYLSLIKLINRRNVFQFRTRFFFAFVEPVERTKLGKVLEYLHVGRVLLGLVKGIQGLCGGRVALTETKIN